MRYCWKCGKPSGVYELCPECQEKKNQEDEAKNETINQTVNVENESTPFKDGCLKTFGGGCGCVGFLIASLLIGIVIIALMFSR